MKDGDRFWDQSGNVNPRLRSYVPASVCPGEALIPSASGEAGVTAPSLELYMHGKARRSDFRATWEATNLASARTAFNHKLAMCGELRNLSYSPT